MLSNHLNRIVLLMGMFRCDVQTMLRCRYDAFSLSQLAKRKEKHRHILSNYVVEMFDVFDLKKFIVCPSHYAIAQIFPANGFLIGLHYVPYLTHNFLATL